MTTKGKIAGAAAIIVIAATLSKIFGFILNVIIAAKLGTTGQTDAYLVAITIPALMRDILAGGALASAFIPVFSSYLAKGQNNDAQKVSTGIINLLGVGLVLMAILGIIYAPYLVKFVAPGFKGKTFELTVSLSKVIFPSIIFFGIASILGSILNAYQHFSAPAFTPLILNLCIITAAFILYPKLGVFGFAIGMVMGGLAQVLIQIPALIKRGVKYSLNFKFNHPGVRRIGLLWGPLMIGLSVNHINIVVNRMLASTLSSGSIAALNFADLLNQTPVGLFGVALSTAVFPSLSWQVAQEDMKKFRSTVSTAIRMIFFITFPITIVFMMIGVPIIRLLFQRGLFDVSSTHATATALFYYAIGMFALATNYIIIKVYYALQDTKTPVKIGVGVIILNIILNFILIRFLGHGGLALATSIAAIIQMVILFIILVQKVKELDIYTIINAFVKIVIISILSGGIGYLISKRLEIILPPVNMLNQVIQIGGTFLVIIFVYLILGYLFKMEEGKLILEEIKMRIKGIG